MFIQVTDTERNDAPVWINTDRITLMCQVKHNTALVISGIKGTLFVRETAEETKRMMEGDE